MMEADIKLYSTSHMKTRNAAILHNTGAT